MVKRFWGKAKRATAIILAASMMMTCVVEPLEVSADETVNAVGLEESDSTNKSDPMAGANENAGEIESSEEVSGNIGEKESIVEKYENTSIEQSGEEQTSEEQPVEEQPSEEEPSVEQTSEEQTSEDQSSKEETETEETTETETETEELTTEETLENSNRLFFLRSMDSSAFVNAKTLELDITAGLSADTPYMEGMVYVGTDMTYKSGSATLISAADNETTTEVSGYVTNSVNPSVTDGTGALLQFVPEYDGIISVGGQLGGGKTFFVDTLAGENIYSYENVGDKANLLFENIVVDAGETYYIYAKGTKMRFYSLSYTYEEEAAEDTPITSDIPAFPGVEGGGKYITGGRGKQVYTVTNLNDDGEGSLRWALEQAKATDGGTIVFTVSGNIELKSSLRFDQVKNVTIAGQTAPGDGITISGYDTNISNSENVIIRYLRFRPGALNVYSGGDSMDAMWGRDNDGFVIDHCSFSWNTDECLSLYRGENGTVQWCLVYESLTLSGHNKGRHGYGGITGGDNVTFHHNLYANHTSRNPRLGGGYAGNADENHVAVTQMNNNVIYNWGFNTTYGGGYTYTNYINNYAIAGPGTRDSVKNWIINPGESSKVGGFYINGNYISSYQNRLQGLLTGNLSTIADVNQYGSYAGGEVTQLRTEAYLSADSTGENASITNVGFDEYLTSGLPSTESTYAEVLTKSGATYPKRDAQDARIVAEVKNGEGRYINTEHEVGGYLSGSGVIIEKRPEDWDTDGDGIPNAWEEEHGLDAENREDSLLVSSLSEDILQEAGYTNLEVYLNSLVDMNHVAENPNTSIISPKDNESFTVGNKITVNLEASSDFGYDVQKAVFYYGTLTASKQFAEAAIINGKASAVLPELKDGSYFIMARVYDSAGNATQTSAKQIHINTSDEQLLEAGWHSQSIGNVDVEGSASLTDNILTVKGNGKLGKEEGSLSGSKEADAATDAFHYVYQEWTGDMELTAKLDSISSVDNHAFAGIMVREDLDEDSASAVLGLSWTKTEDSIGAPWAMYLASRDKKGGSMSNLADPLDYTNAEEAKKYGILLRPAVKFKNGATELGYWLRLVRQGNIFSAYCSANGQDWELIGSKTIAMSEHVYIGFAADSNRAANDLVQLNTARFSNITLMSNIYNITYNLEGITLVNQPETITEGNDLTLTLTTKLGYCLPKTVLVQIGDDPAEEMELALSDPMEGTLTIQNITGAVTITAAAIEDTAGVPQVSLTEYDNGDFLTITQEDNAMILSQTATEGRMTSKPANGDFAVNVSYYAFPKTKESQTLEADITILGRENNDTSKDKGLFVGVFEIGNGQEYFSSLGFRNISGLSGDDGKGGLTGYWIKDPVSKGAGNGGSKSNNGAASNDYNTKPSYELNKTYHVIFEKTNNGYKVTYTGTYANADSGVYPAGKSDFEDMNLYKIFSDDILTLEDEVQYGFALIGVTAKIENMKLTDAKGRTIYDQNAQNTTEEDPISPDVNTGDSTNNSTQTQEPQSSSPQTPTNLVQLPLAEVPLSEQIQDVAELPYANLIYDTPQALLKQELMAKYYGRNLYLMAFLGNGIGYTISHENLGLITEDITLGSVMDKMENFAADFETFRVKSYHTKMLDYEVGVHIHLGTEYADKVAYIFSKNIVTGEYYLNKAMTVTTTGNVAWTSKEMTEVLILVQS